jgi:hypothetical protein
VKAAEDAHATVDPELKDGEQLVPQAAPIGRFEVERVDVLILFGGIFGVLDAAVGAVLEPVRMLGDPGVVRRALEGDVEGQLHAVGLNGGKQMVEVSEVAELGMNGLVAAFGGADLRISNCPRAALVVGAGGGAVIGSLAEGASDGMYGRQVENIEAHGGDLRQLELYVGEGAVTGWIGRS